MSMVQSKSLRTYLERRVLRIYPAYLMAFVLCIFALGPFVGERPWEHLPQTIGRALLLREPADYPGQLLGLPIPSLNGSMWTIAHEFRCYLLVAALGTVGLLARRRIILALAVTAAAATIVGTFPPVSTGLDHLRTHPRIVALVIGDPWSALRLTTAFMAGSVGYLYRAEIASRLNSWVALGSIVIAMAFMLNTHTADVGLTIFGGLALFWLALEANLGRLQRVNDNWDISYGTYLYGWPIAITILYFNRQITPLALTAISLPLALLAGTASWWLVEVWTKDLLRSRSNPPEMQMSKNDVAPRRPSLTG